MRFFTPSSLGESRKLTPEGFLVVESVPIARVGEMDYAPGEVDGVSVGTDGVVRMSRTEAELFSPETLSSFEGKPVTLGHPPGNWVDADTWDSHAVGHVQGVRRGSGDQAGFIVADIIVQDSGAIDQINNGLRELSCGYEYQAIEITPGNGEQKEIRGNHVALVTKARGGSDLRIGDQSKQVSKMRKLPWWARAMGHAIKAGDEETAAEIAEERDKEKEGDEDDEDEKEKEKEKSGDSAYVTRGDLNAFKAEILAALNPAQTAGDQTAADAAAWQEVASGAAIIAPALTIDKTGTPAAAKAQALGLALSGPLGATVRRIIGDKSPDKLDTGSIGIAFAAVVEAQRAANNARQSAGDGNFGIGMGFSGITDPGGFEIVRHQ